MFQNMLAVVYGSFGVGGRREQRGWHRSGCSRSSVSTGGIAAGLATKGIVGARAQFGSHINLPSVKLRFRFSYQDSAVAIVGLEGFLSAAARGQVKQEKASLSRAKM